MKWQELEQEIKFLSQEELLSKETASGVFYHLLQPPDLDSNLKSWNARVKLDIPWYPPLTIGAHINNKPTRPEGCGDWISAFDIPITGENNELLGHLIALMGIDALSHIDQEDYLAKVLPHISELQEIYPTISWLHPDIATAHHQRRLFESEYFDKFAKNAAELIRSAHNTNISKNEFDGISRLNSLTTILGWDLFKAQSTHNLHFFQAIAKVCDSHASEFCSWNFRAAHGQILYYLPNPDRCASWITDFSHPIKLSHRLQSNADVLAIPNDLSSISTSFEHATANTNLLTDAVIDDLRKKDESKARIKELLIEKLETQFSAFPVSYTDYFLLSHSNQITHYPDINQNKPAGSVNTDGITASTYRHRSVKNEKSWWQIGNDCKTIIDHGLPLTDLSSRLDQGGFTIDDRALIALS